MSRFSKGRTRSKIVKQIGDRFCCFIIIHRFYLLGGWGPSAFKFKRIRLFWKRFFLGHPQFHANQTTKLSSAEWRRLFTFENLISWYRTDLDFLLSIQPDHSEAGNISEKGCLWDSEIGDSSCFRFLQIGEILQLTETYVYILILSIDFLADGRGLAVVIGTWLCFVFYLGFSWICLREH